MSDIPAAGTATSRLSFLHISDIHFTSDTAELTRRNEDLRRSLLDDASRIRAKHGNLSGILVGGDVAYHGRKSEFDLAGTWLDALCDAVGCSNRKFGWYQGITT